MQQHQRQHGAKATTYREAKQQAGFAHSRVPNEQQLEKVVTASGQIQKRRVSPRLTSRLRQGIDRDLGRRPAVTEVLAARVELSWLSCSWRTSNLLFQELHDCAPLGAATGEASRRDRVGVTP